MNSEQQINTSYRIMMISFITMLLVFTVGLVAYGEQTESTQFTIEGVTTFDMSYECSNGDNMNMLIMYSTGEVLVGVESYYEDGSEMWIHSETYTWDEYSMIYPDMKEYIQSWEDC